MDIGQWTNGQTDMDKLTNGHWTDGQMDKWTNGHVMDGQMDIFLNDK